MNARPTPLTDERLADLTFATAHFEALRGLVILPGLVFLTGFFGFAAWAGSRLDGSAVWPIGGGLGITLALLSSALISRWYRRTYGEVAPATRRVAPWLAGVGAVIVLVAIARALPITGVSAEGVVTGTALVAVGAVLRAGLGSVLIPCGALMVTASVLSLGEWIGSASHPVSRTPVLLGAVCMVWAVTAVRSHMVLKRALRPDR